MRADVTGAWARYEPDTEEPWDLRRVVHLHRRAGFAATWDELQRDLRDRPEATIARLLEGRSRASGVPEGFEATSTLLADAAVASNDPARLKAWWVYRMAFGPDPLGERLTLMWHGHFATGNLKVDDLALMRRQNVTLRRLARAPFAELLGAAARDPALLVWLDAPANRKGHPNENFARELMELFTVGIGPYSEADVKEAARALTGRAVEAGTLRRDRRPSRRGREDDPRPDRPVGRRRPRADSRRAPGHGRSARLEALRPLHGRGDRRCPDARRPGRRPPLAWPRRRPGGRRRPSITGLLRRCQHPLARD